MRDDWEQGSAKDFWATAHLKEVGLEMSENPPVVRHGWRLLATGSLQTSGALGRRVVAGARGTGVGLLQHAEVR